MSAHRTPGAEAHPVGLPPTAVRELSERREMFGLHSSQAIFEEHLPLVREDQGGRTGATVVLPRSGRTNEPRPAVLVVTVGEATATPNS